MRFKAKFLRASRIYYHGSNHYLEVGTILEPRSGYEQNWGYNWWYQALERHRPKHMLSHKEAVFMCDNESDIDICGGGTEWLFTVEPLGPVERHDLNWGSAVECAISEMDDIDLFDDKVAILCHNYWTGVPGDDPAWEYLTPKARVLAVEEF